MSVLTKFQKIFNISVKELSQEKLVRFFAWTGDKNKVVKSSKEGYIYVTDYNGRTYTVFNQIVPLIANRFVEVGQKRKSAVIEVIREVEAYPTQKTVNIPNHNKNHEWPGQDTVWVRQEQFFGGGLAIPENNSMTIVFTGFIYRLNGFHLLVNQTLDLTSYVPDEGAFYLLVQVDESGVVSYVEGDAVDGRELLEYEDIPEPESDRLELFAVKMYAGQTQIVKARTDTDVIDLRWARQNKGTGSGIETVVAGTGIGIDNSDPANPVVSATGVIQRILAANLTLADGESLVVSDYIDGNGFDLTLEGDASLVILSGRDLPARSGSAISSATPTINTDVYDSFELTAQAVDITSMTTNLSGTPTRNQVLLIVINAVADIDITWGASFDNGDMDLPIAILNGETATVMTRWSVAASKHICMSSSVI